MKNLFTRSLLLGLLFTAGGALAQATSTPPLPEWDKLTPPQREALIAPVRERGNSDVEQRPRMLEHAQRWNSMTPEQRKQAHKGMRRFEGMNPRQREEARVLFVHMVKLTPEERQKLLLEHVDALAGFDPAAFDHFTHRKSAVELGAAGNQSIRRSDPGELVLALQVHPHLRAGP